MIKQLVLPIVAVAAVVIGVGIFIQKGAKLNLGQPQVTATATPASQVIITVGSKITRVTIAKTEADREKGLSGVKTMDLDSGMLFIFDEKQVKPAFWMKGMLIPLDIIWISGGKVAKIDRNILPPATNTPDNQLKVYTPGTPVDYVLEVNSGFSDNNAVSIGSGVELSKIQ